MRPVVLFTSGLLLLGGYFAYSSGNSAVEAELPVVANKPTMPPREEALVLVAKRPLSQGQLIDPYDLTWQQATSLPEGESLDLYRHFIKGMISLDSLDGAVVRRDLQPGQPVTHYHLAKQGEPDFLAAVIRPGMRAISITIDKVGSSSGLIQPGNYVDVILTSYKDGSKSRRGGNVDELIATTVLENVRIIAINNRVEQLAQQRTAADLHNNESNSGTATLEVLPEQAQKLALAGKLGDLVLSLRSMLNKDQHSESSVMSASAVSTAFPTEEPKLNVVLMHGTKRRELNNSEVKTQSFAD